MEVDNSLSQQIRASFGDKTLYEILNVETTASSEDIRRGYRRMALKLHPDKGGDSEQFKALCVVHAILSDEDRRRVYDATGEVDTHEMSEEAAVWYDYFRNLFPKVTVNKIEEFSKSYKDSEEERGDVIKYYNRYEGDFSSIMDSVMLAEDEDMDRIIAIIRDCLSTGELGSYAICFDQTSSKYVANYKKRLEAERKATATGKPKKSKKQDNSDDLLQQMISNNARRRGGEDSIFADIMSKYSSHAEKGAEKKKAKVYDDISDCDFEATRARVMAKKRKHP